MKQFLLACVTASLLLTACASSAQRGIVDGAEWFLNNQDESFLHYEYDPHTDEWAEVQHSMREMGAMWSISQMWRYLDDERYEALSYRGFEHFAQHFEYDAENDLTYVNITPQKIKLGYNAFAILTLLELDYEDKEALLQTLANGILYLQEDSGELRTFFYSDRDTGTDYYPGQALLAIMHLYNETGDPAYLEVMRKAFDYYSEVYWAQSPNTAFVPWQSQAFAEYYAVEPRQDVADFVFAMNDFMVASFAEEVNSCDSFDTSAGVVMAVYMEGMNPAYALAEELGETRRAECYANFIRQSADAVLELQFPNGIEKPHQFSKAADGGFYGSTKDQTMRVDRNQHAIMGLMGAKKLGLID